jgi:hypothetical protein
MTHVLSQAGIIEVSENLANRWNRQNQGGRLWLQLDFQVIIITTGILIPIIRDHAIQRLAILETV